MPIWDGEIVLNVWTEAAKGDLMVLIGRTDALLEISRVLKLGRVQVHLSPAPMGGFRQTLSVYAGALESIGESSATRPSPSGKNGDRPERRHVGQVLLRARSFRLERVT